MPPGVYDGQLLRRRGGPVLHPPENERGHVRGNGLSGDLPVLSRLRSHLLATGHGLRDSEEFPHRGLVLCFVRHVFLFSELRARLNSAGVKPLPISGATLGPESKVIFFIPNIGPNSFVVKAYGGLI